MEKKVQEEKTPLEIVLKMQTEVKKLTEHVIRLRSDLNEIILMYTIQRAKEQESQENKEA